MGGDSIKSPEVVMKKATVIGAAVITGVSVGVFTLKDTKVMKDTAEYLKIKKMNMELLDKIHFVNDKDCIDRQFAKELANCQNITAIEKERLRNKVIVEYFNNDNWRPNGCVTFTTREA